MVFRPAESVPAGWPSPIRTRPLGAGASRERSGSPAGSGPRARPGRMARGGPAGGAGSAERGAGSQRAESGLLLMRRGRARALPDSANGATPRGRLSPCLLQLIRWHALENTTPTDQSTTHARSTHCLHQIPHLSPPVLGRPVRPARGGLTKFPRLAGRGWAQLAHASHA